MKKSNGLIIVIIIMALCIVGLCGYILYDHKLIDEKNNKKENDKKVIDKVEISDEEVSLMKLVSENSFLIKHESLDIKSLDAEELIGVLVNLSKKDITTVTGTELKEIAKKYYNIDNVEFAPIKCFNALKDDIHMGDSQYMLKYNSSIDKYEWNINHPGHGGNSTGNRFYLNEKDYSYKDGKYYYNMNVFYYNNGCIGDTCGPNSYYNIYFNLKDLENDTNKYLNAVTNDKYCQTVEEGLYNCDNDVIYSDIKDKLHNVTFVFTKNGDNLILDSYKFN